VAILALTILIGYIVLAGGFNLLPRSGARNVFSLFNLFQHLDLILIAFAIAAISSWSFWRICATVSGEVLLLSLCAIYLLAGHRNFRLDSPQIVNTAAWTLGIGNLTMLVVAGVTLLVLVGFYLFFATMPARPIASFRNTSIAHFGRRSLVLNVSALLLLALLVGGTAALVFSHFSVKALALTANGVGQEDREGLSPLGFQSALGSTNQPSALLRLEGDYPDNPLTPMLYLRESALSEFNGHEMVIADSRFDRDVSGVMPEQAYTAETDPTIGPRTKLTQSIYLLTEHKLAFGADYPVSMARLKNPNPSRFRGTFRAVSEAPAWPKDALRNDSVGDPRWDASDRAHYLKQHSDPRYASLAKEITKDAISPIDQAFLLTDYLSKQSIYTLTPNHEVEKDADPVAPYLFGDMRGYCVHFAHAMVYMFRSLGIPARIGTGYLTDLSEARDGHVLLRMSDRHAWAEAYITGRGWVPFDIQPDQVESHADSQVDMKLLEELMGMLDPGEEILPKDIAKDEANVEEEWNLPTVSWRHIVFPLVLALFLLGGLKFFLLHGWKFATSPQSVARGGTRAIMALLYDLGVRRQVGETRQQFRARLENELNLETLSITAPLNAMRYAGADRGVPSAIELRTMIKGDLERIKSHFGKRSLVAVLSPRAAWANLWGASW